MNSLDLENNKQELLLKTTTQIMKRSFDKLPLEYKLLFARANNQYVNPDKISLNRKLWDFRQAENSQERRVVIRYDIQGSKNKNSGIIVNAGITNKLGQENDRLRLEPQTPKLTFPEKHRRRNEQSHTWRKSPLQYTRRENSYRPTIRPNRIKTLPGR